MVDNSETETESITNEETARVSHLILLFVICIACLFYFGYSQSSSKDDIQNVIKIRPNLDDSTVFYHNKVYVHPSLSMPQISIKLLNEMNIHIESSSQEQVNLDHVLSWTFKENSRIHFRPFNTKYGLIGVSVCKTAESTVSSDRHFTYFGLIRANRKLCETRSPNSWTCQKDHDYFNSAFDSAHCILVVKSNKLTEILQFTHDFMENHQVPHTNLELGMFCGNPLIARSANTDRDLFFVNTNVEPVENGNSFFVCKYSSLVKDVNECYNMDTVAYKMDMPLMLMHDPTSDVLVSANYNQENRNLSFVTFRCNRLGFKSVFRSIPSPSGWVISLGLNSKGKVFFAGDSAPYEVLGIYDVANSKEKYHNLYL